MIILIAISAIDYFSSRVAVKPEINYSELLRQVQEQNVKGVTIVENSIKGQLADGGKKLELRGFIGVAALGRNQTWIRAN